MENKIKTIQVYFKDQIMAWNFTYSIEKDDILLVIDTKYKFSFYVINWLAFQSVFWTPEEQFMYLEISPKEEYKFWEIFIELIIKNKWIEQKEKDLKEFERIKKLYNLI